MALDLSTLEDTPKRLETPLSAEPLEGVGIPAPEEPVSLDLSSLEVTPANHGPEENEASGWLMQTAKTGTAGISQMVLNTAKFIWQTPGGAARYAKGASEGWRSLGLPAWTDPFAFPAEVFRVIDEGVDFGDFHAAGTGDIADTIGNAVEILPEISPTFARLGMKTDEAAEATAALLEGRTDLLKAVATDPEAWAAFIGNGLPTLYMAWKSGGNLSFMGWLEAMDAANNIEEYEERTGEKISHAQFVMATAAVGAANAFLEKAGLDAILGKWAKGKGKWAWLTGFIVGGTSEGGTELMQEIVQNVAGLGYDEELREQASDAINEGEWEPFLKKMSEGTLPAMMGGTGLGGPAGSFGAGLQSMAERQNAIQRDETTRIKARPGSMFHDLGGREHYTEKDIEKLGLEKVEVTQDLLERAARGDPLNDDETYTLTEQDAKLGRFAGEAGSERITLLVGGMEQLREFQAQEELPAAVEIEEIPVVEEITLEGETVETTGRLDISTLEDATSATETFVSEIHKTKEPRKSIRDRLRRAVARTETEPTEEQIEAGNYRKGHIRVQAVPVSIETPKGATRSGTDRKGRAWSAKMKDNYGYIKGTKGKDKDHLDVFVGQYPESDSVVVINQKKNAEDPMSEGNFDEHKIMLGYKDPQSAIKAYDRNYDDGGALKGSAVAMTMSEFKEWMKNEDTTKAAEANVETIYRGESTVSEKQGPFYTGSREFAQQFTQTGTAEEVIERTIRKDMIYESTETYAGDPEAVDAAIAKAKAAGKKAVRLSEGVNQPPSLFVFDQTAFEEPIAKIGPRPIVRRKTNEGKGMTVAKVQDAVRPFYRMFRTAPAVRVVEAVEDLPSDIQMQLRSAGDQGLTNGVYVQDALTDTIYLIANNTSNSQEAIETLIHEVIGHYGLHQTVPSYVFTEVMDKVAKSFPKEVREAAVTQGLDFTNPAERRIAAEEFIAYMSQRMVRNESVPAKIKQYIRELVQAIRNRLRVAFGGEEMFTDAQIWSMIGQATDYVQNPGGFKRDQHRGLLRHMTVPTYFSQAFKVLNEDDSKLLSPADWMTRVNMHIRKGRIKQVEVDWMGLEAWLEDLTWNDIAAMTHHSDELLPLEIQRLKEQKKELETALASAGQGIQQRYDYRGQREPRTDPLSRSLRMKLRDLNNKLTAIGKTTPPKVTKEAILRFMDLNGTSVSVYPPGGDPTDAPNFDESYPDEEIEPEEDDWMNEWDDLRDQWWESYYDAALIEVHAENGWSPDITADDVAVEAEEAEISEEELDDKDTEELNMLTGNWTGESEDSMEETANEQATESLEADHYDDERSEWWEKHTERKWFEGDISVSKDSDGDYQVHDHEDGEDIGSYFSSMEEVNDAVQEHYEDRGSQKWHEYVLPGGRDYENLLFVWDNIQDTEIFQETGHWPERDWNYFAHARFDVRTDLNGEAAILVDEMQSDWHQAVRDRVEEALSDIHAEHGYDPKWWKQEGVRFGGEKYDGHPLNTMKDEAREIALGAVGSEREMETKQRTHYENEYSKEDTGIGVLAQAQLLAWNVPFDNATIEKYVKQARGQHKERGVALMTVWASMNLGVIGGNWARFTRANVEWKSKELYKSHGWEMPDVSEETDARTRELNIETAYQHWEKGKDWDGTDHTEIMQEGIDWLRSMQDLATLKVGDVNPFSQTGAKVERQETAEGVVPEEEGPGLVSHNQRLLVEGAKESDDYFETMPSWEKYIKKNYTAKSPYYRIGSESVETAQAWSSLAVAAATITGKDEFKHNALRTKWEHFRLEFTEHLSALERSRKAVTLAPFEQTWQTVVMKNLISEAVRRGHKRIFFQTGEVHGIRWGGSPTVDDFIWEKGISKIEDDEIIDTRTPDLFTGELRKQKKGKPIEWVIVTSDGSNTIKIQRSKLHTIVGREAARVVLDDKADEGTVTSDMVNNPIRWGSSERLTGGREVYNSITVFQMNKFLKPFKAKVKIGAFQPEGRDPSKYVSAGANIRQLDYDSALTNFHPDIVTDEEIEVLYNSRASAVHHLAKSEGRPYLEDQPKIAKEKMPIWGMRGPEGELLENMIFLDAKGAQHRLQLMREQEMAGNFGVEAWEIEITPKLRDAVNNTGFALFSKKGRRTGHEKIDKALESLEKKVGPPKSRGVEKIQQRWREIEAIQGKGRKLEQALVDQFAGIKYAIREAHGYDLSAEVSGYKQAHFTTSGDSQMYAFLMHGIPEWRDGVTQIKEGTKGLLEIFEPVADTIDEWGRWMAAMRAKRLMTEGRENLITEDEIEGMDELGELMPIYAEVAAEFADWKSQFLDWAQETGVINADTRPLWEHADYVPFFRIKAEELGGSFDKRAGQGTAGIANQLNPIKRLRGGTDPIGDIMENILINFSQIASTAMKNQATRLTIENLEGTGMIEPVKGADFMQQEMIAEGDLIKKLKAAGVEPTSMDPKALEAMRKMWTIQVPQGDDVISVLVNGKKKYYHVHEETLLRSLNAINIQRFNSLAARLGMWLPRKAKRLLTTMITLDPGFMAANWFRDVAMAFTNSRHAKFPRPDMAFIGAYKALVQSKEMVSMMAAGGAFYQGYVNAMDPGATVKQLKRAMRKTRVRNRVLDAPWKFIELYQDLGAAAENANRIAQGYIPAIKAGAGTAEAVWESKDLMNFAKHGDNGAMQFLIQTVPFLNARIQGLVRFGQRFHEAPGITITKSLLYTFAVMALYLGNKDDERYKELPEEEKDMYVHFWLNGKHWRLPKAFEVGMLFGTAFERMYQYWESNEDDAGQLALNRMKFILDEVFMMMDPTTIIPMPQLIKPLYEASTNWNGFFQSPIVPEYMQDIAKVKPDMVYRPSTSPALRELAKRMPRFMPHTFRNPMLLQHLVRGYFGTIGGHIMMLTDDLVRKNFDYPPRPELRWSQMPVAGRFYRGEDQPSRTNYEEIVYELRNTARAIERTITQMEREEMDDEIDAFKAEPSHYNTKFSNEEVVDASKSINASMNEIRRLRGELNAIWVADDMTPEEKLREINQLYREKADEFRDAYRERPGSSEQARTTVGPRVSTYALLDELHHMSQKETHDFLAAAGLSDTAALVNELPLAPKGRFRNLMADNE